MKHSTELEKAKNTEQFQEFKQSLRELYPDDPMTAAREAAKAYTAALKLDQIDRRLLFAVDALIPVLTECTGKSAQHLRYDVQTIARHALIPEYSWRVITLICEPMHDGQPGPVLWSPVPIDRHSGMDWESADTAATWQQLPPIVAQHMERYHGSAALPVDQIRQALDGARSRVYRTTNGTANTWIHYQHDGQRFSARISMQRFSTGQDDGQDVEL